MISAPARFAIAMAFAASLSPEVMGQLQIEAPYELAQLSGPIRLDGLSDEPAWESVEPFRPLQYEPDNGSEPTERTEMLVAYDDDYIYFSLRAFDSDPNGLRANTLYRDRLSGDDHFEILLDTFNDNETAVLFTTTPAGIRKDAAISNDASGGGIASGGWINGSFNTYWDVETTINEDGWFAELRVPFSSLRFQPDESGNVVMGIGMQRKVARKTERLVYPPVEPIANWAFLKPSLAKKVMLRGLKSTNPVYITAYGLGGLDRGFELNPTNTAYLPQEEWKRDVGVDIKYGITNNLGLDLTVNTDFAQVEADDQQVNLTRFSLFFPEKRQFFQERSSVFDFRTGGLSRLFHSRRIGLAEDGTPVRILGGARLVGRAGSWDIGAINMQTGRQDGLPSENFGVYRVRRQVLNPYSYAGGMVTSRLGPDGAYNVGLGLDAVYRIAGDDYLTLQLANTLDDGIGGFKGSATRFTAEVERRRKRGWGFGQILAYAGSNYDPGIGFTQRNNFTLLDSRLDYSWLAAEDSPFIRTTLGTEGFAFIRNGEGTIESAEFGPTFEWDSKNGTGGGFSAHVVYEDLVTPFQLSSDAVVPTGDYTFLRISGDYHMSHTDLLQFSAQANAGTFYDGWQSTLVFSPRWYVSKHLELRGTYQYSHVEFGKRDQTFDAHLARLAIGTALNTKLSTNVFLQYNTAVNAFSANVRFRYNLREGNDLWIVYDQGVNTNLDRFTVRLPRVDNRTILVKYTHTFRL